MTCIGHAMLVFCQKSGKRSPNPSKVSKDVDNGDMYLTDDLEKHAACRFASSPALCIDPLMHGRV